MNRILLDQGLPRSAAKILGIQGWDVLHTGEIGLSNTSRFKSTADLMLKKDHQ